MKTWGRLDAVVANAAILRDKPFDEMTLQDFDDVIDVNLRGVMRVLHPAFKAMKAGGGGRILAITSSSGLLGARAQANYAAAKSGLIGPPAQSHSRENRMASKRTSLPQARSGPGCTSPWWSQQHSMLTQTLTSCETTRRLNC